MTATQVLTAAAFGALALSVLTSNSDAASAIGCCMERQEANSRYPWIQVGQDLDDCKRRNRQKDRNDNIIRPTGKVWWNIKC